MPTPDYKVTAQKSRVVGTPSFCGTPAFLLFMFPFHDCFLNGGKLVFCLKLNQHFPGIKVDASKSFFFLVGGGGKE